MTITKPVVTNGVTKANAELFNEYGDDIETLSGQLAAGQITESQLATSVQKRLIPTGGSAGQYLAWKAAGEGTWATPPTGVSKSEAETIATAAAEKVEVDGALAVATTALTKSGLTRTANGVALNTAGMKVLLTAQSSGVEDGLWEVASGAWTRPTSFKSGVILPLGAFVTVAEGTEGLGGSIWVLKNKTAVTVETSAQEWEVNSTGSGVSGAGAEFVNVLAGSNIAIGEQILTTLKGKTKAEQETAHWNIGLGYETLTVLTTGKQNIGLGTYALKSNTTGSFNVALGSKSLEANTVGNANLAVGIENMPLSKEAEYNTAIGGDILLRAEGTSGKPIDNTTAIGISVLEEAKQSIANVAIGGNSMGNLVESAGYNVAIGVETMMGSGEAAGTAKGHGKAYGEGTTTKSVAIGHNAMRGPRGEGTTQAANNTVSIGFESLAKVTSGAGNVALGMWTLLETSTGSYNTVGGYGAGALNTTGEKNTYFGYEAGEENKTGSGNVFIGFQVGKTLTGSNTLAIGNSSTITAMWIRGEESGKKIAFCGKTPIEPHAATHTETTKALWEHLEALGLA